MSQKIDLFLGGDIGLWALQHVRPDEVGHVVTVNESLARAAREIHPRVFIGNANELEFARSSVGVSVHYERIFKEPLIRTYRKLYNLHPGYLPWGRGYYPVFWSLWEQTPAGCTLHEVSAGIDTGSIVAQRRVEHREDDTGGSLHQRVIAQEKELFAQYWPRIVAGDLPQAHPQPPGGSYHCKADFFDVKQRTDCAGLSAVELIRLIRALTFPGYSGMEIRCNGSAMHLRADRLQPVASEAVKERS